MSTTYRWSSICPCNTLFSLLCETSPSAVESLGSELCQRDLSISFRLLIMLSTGVRSMFDIERKAIIWWVKLVMVCGITNYDQKVGMCSLSSILPMPLNRRLGLIHTAVSRVSRTPQYEFRWSDNGETVGQNSGVVSSVLAVPVMPIADSEKTRLSSKPEWRWNVEHSRSIDIKG